MKAIISIALLISAVLFTNKVQAQSSNYVGKWETTTAVAFNNNSVARIKISGTDYQDYLIITRYETPKKKIGAKYDADSGRLYTNIKGHQIYFMYDPLTDMLEVHKMNDALVCYMTRFQ